MDLFEKITLVMGFTSKLLVETDRYQQEVQALNALIKSVSKELPKQPEELSSDEQQAVQESNLSLLSLVNLCKLVAVMPHEHQIGPTVIRILVEELAAKPVQDNNLVTAVLLSIANEIVPNLYEAAYQDIAENSLLGLREKYPEAVCAYVYHVEKMLKKHEQPSSELKKLCDFYRNEGLL